MEPTSQRGCALLATLRQLDTAVIADVLDEFGYPNQTISRALAPSTGTVRFAGLAACVQMTPRVDDERAYDDFSAVDALAGPDVVLVLSCGGNAGGAVIGEFMAREFQRRGAVAVLTDGAARDSAVIAQMGFTVYSKGTSPLNGARRLKTESTTSPVHIAGETAEPVAICPGDFLVADDDGVVVVPQHIVSELVEAASLYASAERDVAAAMVGGTPRVSALKTHNRVSRIQPVLAKLMSGDKQ
ncbi:RraA family protein [Paraburkholderia azotifigens]|uniref:Putative 4-hydroxy-4-methyl-2-oxoglutarate aldolase n=1 Tax=Paraburkholderia azotifigens TaxID=2057004 RepID=A0ABU9REL3_9BURK